MHVIEISMKSIMKCFVTFPCGDLGQVRYLVVLIPDLCFLTTVPIRRCLFIDYLIMVLIIWALS